MKTINLDDHAVRMGGLSSVVVGDVVVFMGRPHQVDVMEAYDPPAEWGITGESRIARSADGWGITVFDWVGDPQR